MPLVIDKWTGLISGTITQLDVPIGGTSVRCLSATVDFQISFDDSPFVPFGQAREIQPKNPDGTPYRFSRFVVKIADGDGTANTITLVLGAINYLDTRSQLFPDQTIRATAGSSLTGILYTSASAVVPLALGGSTSEATLLVNVRNTHATNSAILGTNSTQVAAGSGYILGPGENVDLPLQAALYALAPVGTTLNVSRLKF